MDHFGLWRLYNVDRELGLYLLLIQWLSTNVYRCTPHATVTNPHNRPLPGIKGNPHTVS